MNQLYTIIKKLKTRGITPLIFRSLNNNGINIKAPSADLCISDGFIFFYEENPKHILKYSKYIDTTVAHPTLIDYLKQLEVLQNKKGVIQQEVAYRPNIAGYLSLQQHFNQLKCVKR
jgi:hypothetical protein